MENLRIFPRRTNTNSEAQQQSRRRWIAIFIVVLVDIELVLAIGQIFLTVLVFNFASVPIGIVIGQTLALVAVSTFDFLFEFDMLNRGLGVDCHSPSRCSSFACSKISLLRWPEETTQFSPECVSAVLSLGNYDGLGLRCTLGIQHIP